MMALHEKSEGFIKSKPTKSELKIPENMRTSVKNHTGEHQADVRHFEAEQNKIKIISADFSCLLTLCSSSMFSRLDGGNK